MIKKYNLPTQGLEFKSDFNWKFELIKHLLQIRTTKGYLKMDIIKYKKSNKIYISKRTADFLINKAVFEIKEFSFNYPDIKELTPNIKNEKTTKGNQESK